MPNPGRNRQLLVMNTIAPPGEIAKLIDDFFDQKPSNMDALANDMTYDKRLSDSSSTLRNFNDCESLVCGGHQYCMSDKDKKAIGAKLQEIEKEYPGFKEFKSFEEIYDVVKDAIKDMHGVGPLAIYDIALRIAWTRVNHPNVCNNVSDAERRQILPKEYVYLQSGALEGALDKLLVNGLKSSELEPIPDTGGYRIKTKELANIFNHAPVVGFEKYWDPNNNVIPAWIIEDILCVNFKPRDVNGKKKTCHGC